MNLEKMSWLAGIVAVPVMLLTWFFKPKEFVSFCKDSWKFVLAMFFVVALVTAWIRSWFNWLTHPVTLPLWVLILLLGLLFVFGVLLIAASLKKPLLQIETDRTTSPAQEPTRPAQPAQPTQPDWHNFVSDEIFGVLWRWSYSGNTILDYDLTAFCPRTGCMNRLEIEFDPQNPNIPRQYLTIPESMTCHHCGFKCHFDCDRQTLQKRVINEIERLINTGQYVQRMAGKI